MFHSVLIHGGMLICIGIFTLQAPMIALNPERQILVYVPESYDKTRQNYPVVCYFHSLGWSNHVYANQKFTRLLDDFGGQHQAEEYSGNAWNQYWEGEERFKNEVIPFLNRYLDSH